MTEVPGRPAGTPRSTLGSTLKVGTQHPPFYIRGCRTLPYSGLPGAASLTRRINRITEGKGWRARES